MISGISKSPKSRKMTPVKSPESPKMSPKDVRRAVYPQVDRFSGKFREIRREDREEGADEFGYYYPYLNQYLDLDVTLGKRGEMPGLKEVRVKDEDELEYEMKYWEEDLNDLLGVLLGKGESMEDKLDAANDILKLLPKVYVISSGISGKSGKSGRKRNSGKSGKSVKIGMPKKRRFV